ncbi:MAG: hypothetical protein AB1486_26155 [Planctomycetota bacterium]
MIDTPVENHRLYSTIISWLGSESETAPSCAGLEPFAVAAGRELSPVFSSTTRGITDFARLLDPDSPERSFVSLYAVQDARWKLVCQQSVGDTRPAPLGLFDLDNDSGEMANRVGGDREALLRLARDLERWLARCASEAIATQPGEPSREAREKLSEKGIGYFGR